MDGLGHDLYSTIESVVVCVFFDLFCVMDLNHVSNITSVIRLACPPVEELELDLPLGF